MCIRDSGEAIQRNRIAYKQHLGYVPEEPNLYGYLTGLEYLQLAGRLRGLDETAVNRKANELLELLTLREARWAPISTYSKGMKQRVLIAAALLHDPDVLVFDEAQSGLDIALTVGGDVRQLAVPADRDQPAGQPSAVHVPGEVPVDPVEPGLVESDFRRVRLHL